MDEFVNQEQRDKAKDQLDRIRDAPDLERVKYRHIQNVPGRSGGTEQGQRDGNGRAV